MRLSSSVPLLVLAASLVSSLAFADGLVTSVLPSSRSAVEGHAVTVFQTVINTSGQALTNCSISHPSDSFSSTVIDYALTDPTTNQVIGTRDVPFNLAVGASQSLVLSITSNELKSGQLRPVVGCTGSTSGQVFSSLPIDGLNTITFSSSAQATPDVIALVASPSNDGVLRIQGNGSNAFAVAVANVGSADTITASVDGGALTLPATTTICQTNTTTGQCLQAPAATVKLSLAANATASFAVFVQASGQIPFYPEGARLFVRFTDSTSTLRGATSVAITNAPTFDSTQPKGGIFSTTFPFGTTTQDTSGIVFVAEDGTVVGFDGAGDVFSGNWSIGSAFTLTGTTLFEPVSGAAFTSTWQGAFAQRAWFSAQALTTVNSSDDFQLGGTYQASAYERGSSLGAVAGAWNYRDPDTGGLLAVMTVASDGSFSVTGAGSSCTLTGQLSLIDARFDLYRMTLNFGSSCGSGPGGATSFSGLAAIIDDRSTNDGLLFVGTNTAAQSASPLYVTRY